MRDGEGGARVNEFADFVCRCSEPMGFVGARHCGSICKGAALLIQIKSRGELVGARVGGGEFWVRCGVSDAGGHCSS